MSPPLSVALYSGIVVDRDAVSDSLRVKLEALRRLVDRGAPIEAVVFTHAADRAFPELRSAPSVGKLVGYEEFWRADLHIFEFGMYYDLVDALYVLPPECPSLVIDHNTTPPELVELPVVRAGCQLALTQRHNLRQATRVASVSEFNLEIARSVGVTEDRLSVLHLPPAHPGRLGPRDFGAGDGARRIELLFVGRLVHAKGVLDLLEATEAVCRSGRCRLRLVGSPRFSDPEVLDRVQTAVATSNGAIELLVDLDPADMVELYAASDLLVIPSYHEGYCVPVIEAYSAGCHVVAYDGTNLPNVVGELGQQVSVGDVGALAAAVERFVERAEESGRRGVPIRVPAGSGDLSEQEWLEAVALHLTGYSAASFERGFLGLVRALAEASRRGLDPALGDAIDTRRAELAA